MPGNALNITLPTVGVTVGPAYATSINLALQTLITDVEANITPDEITINDDMTFRNGVTSYAALRLDRMNFEPKSALPAVASVIDSLFVYDDQLYFQDGDGVNIVMTAAGAVAGAPGNITSTGSPTYSSLTNGLQWSGGDLEYIFTDDGTNDYAGLVFLDAQFRNGANSMTMSSVVTTDYDVIWPAVAPSGTELVQVDSSGAMSFSSTIVDATAFTALITANAGLTAAANQDVTVSGTGRFRHGTRTKRVSGSRGQGDGGYRTTTHGWVITLSSGLAEFPIELEAGKVLTGIDIDFDGESAAATTFALRYTSGGTTAATGAIASSTTAGSQTVSLSFTSGSVTIVAGRTYHLDIIGGSGDTADTVLGIEMSYTD